MQLSTLHTRGRRVHIVSLDIERFTEGPQHDPYGGLKYWVSFSNGRAICLRMSGLGGSQICFKKKGERGYRRSKEAFSKEEERRTVERFERLTGMSMGEFERLFHRRFYFEDPMGSPSSYE